MANSENDSALVHVKPKERFDFFHDERVRAIFMDEGDTVEQNEPFEFFNTPQQPRTKLFLSQILQH